jgi:hypothetical protein
MHVLWDASQGRSFRTRHRSDRCGSDLDEDATGLAIGVDAGEGMMVERHLDGVVFGGALDAGFDVRGDADVDALGAGDGGNHDCSEQQAQEHGSYVSGDLRGEQASSESPSSHGGKLRVKGAKETSEMVNCVCTGSYAT